MKYYIAHRDYTTEFIRHNPEKQIIDVFWFYYGEKGRDELRVDPRFPDIVPYVNIKIYDHIRHVTYREWSREIEKHRSGKKA